MAIVNKFNINGQQVTLDADIIENISVSANDVSYNSSFQYDENTVGDKLSELDDALYNINKDIYGLTVTPKSLTLESGYLMLNANTGIRENTDTDKYKMAYCAVEENTKYHIFGNNISYAADNWPMVVFFSELPTTGVSGILIANGSGEIDQTYSTITNGYIGMFYVNNQTSPITISEVTLLSETKIEKYADDIKTLQWSIYKYNYTQKESTFIDNSFSGSNGVVHLGGSDGYYMRYIQASEGKKYKIESTNNIYPNGWVVSAIYDMEPITNGLKPTKILLTQTQGSSTEIDLQVDVDKNCYIAVYSSGVSTTPLFYEGQMTDESMIDDIDERLKVVEQNEEAPYIIVPSKLFAVVGFEFNVYWDTIIFCPPYGNNTPNVLVQAICNKGSNTKRCYRYNPVSGDEGEYQITFELYNTGMHKIATKTSTLVVINPSLISITNKNVIHLGDSTIDDTCEMLNVLYNQNLKTTLGINTINPIGTRSSYTGCHHEAHTGFRYVSYKSRMKEAKYYVSNLSEIIAAMDTYKESPHPPYTLNGHRISISYINTEEGWFTAENNIVPDGWSGTIQQLYSFRHTPDAIITNVVNNFEFGVFVNSNNQLDFSHYFNNWYNGDETTVDVLVLACGINDCRGAVNETNALLIPIQSIKDIINAFLVFNPSGKVLISIPKISASTIRERHPIDYMINSFNLRKAIIETFDENKYSNNVFVFGECLGMDRFYGYGGGNNEVNVSARYENIKEFDVHDAVHPISGGYAQIADTYLGPLLYYCKD